jgi:hypothetical protein
MRALDVKTTVKVVGTNGQISLGKEFAGQQVLVEEREPGVWLVRTAIVIPQNELWLHQPKASHDLEQALRYAVATSPAESDPEEMLGKLENGRTTKKPRSPRPQ